ncbi:hypothetical protein, partial [Bradyrhizobium nitroreducens]|uniref:hypothetical protein n=1 Tax=Bradyrhizobium nitroreducens TaxID=709803 RepID=UPI001AEF6CC9
MPVFLRHFVTIQPRGVGNSEKQAKISEYLATSTPADLITGPIVSIINKETTMTTISIVTGGTR